MLVTAEMMGVKAGLGWYLQWAQGWAAYANMYSALLVMALMCTGLPPDRGEAGAWRGRRTIHGGYNKCTDNISNSIMRNE